MQTLELVHALLLETDAYENRLERQLDYQTIKLIISYH